jgi:hypothetical protein
MQLLETAIRRTFCFRGLKWERCSKCSAARRVKDAAGPIELKRIRQKETCWACLINSASLCPQPYSASPTR